MSELFYYHRLDGAYVKCETTEKILSREENCCGYVVDDYCNNISFNVMHQINQNQALESKNLMCDYSLVEYQTENDKSWVIIKLAGENRKVKLSQRIFNEKIECDYVMVNSLAEYIRCIEYFRIVGLASHAISVLQHACRQTDEAGKKKIEKIIGQLRDAIKNENVIVRNAGRSGGNLATFQPSHEIVDILTNSEQIISLSESAKYEIKRSVRVYQSGGSLCYYRGVGRTIYPEEPGIFREDRKSEEDRWYREMKIQFQNDLKKKPYLDRLAMLQHYELPTRLLDVTSNPLVALYMAGNTIYTGDPDQSGTGEIVVYYDGSVDEVSNDSYGNNLSYVYDGKAYDSGIILVIAALVKLKYENKERMRKVITTFQEIIDCIELSDCKKREQLYEIINRCVHANAACYEKAYYFSTDEKKSLRKYEMLRWSTVKTPERILQYLWNVAHKSQKDFGKENADIIKDKTEFIKEYYGFISSYRYLLSTVRRENSAYRDHINVFDLMKSFHVRIGRTNDRIQAQAGSFIICGLDPSYIKEKMISSRSKGHVRFFVNRKKEIMKELNALGINDSTMLPDMTHHASYLKSR